MTHNPSFLGITYSVYVLPIWDEEYCSAGTIRGLGKLPPTIGLALQDGVLYTNRIVVINGI